MQACRMRFQGSLFRLAAVALLATLALAPAATARVYTLDECIEIALSENTTLEKAREDLRGAGADVMSSISSVLPSISATLSRTDGLDVSSVRDDASTRGVRASIGASQTLFHGSAFAQIAGAYRGKTATELSLEWTKRQVVFDVKQAYYGLLRAGQLRDVQQEALELAREQLRKTQSLYDLGSASRSDLLKAQVQVGESELALIAAERSAETARAGLALVIGIDVMTDIEPSDPPDESAEAEPAGFDVEQAISSRPDIMAWEQTVVAAERSLLSAKAARWPDLSMSVGYSKNDETFGDLFDKLDDDYDRSVSLELSVPIFRGLSTKASIDRGKSQLRSIKLSLKNARRNAAYEIENARLSVDEGRRSVDVSQAAVSSAGEDLKVSEERFRLRAASMLELIDARVAYSRARAELVDARYNYEIAKAELRLALGL
ncbi:MAG: TolC family protein [Candidatus Eisenbacteria bacterium]|nr:TolC family protein [Candidatus Eisenbacteria bacterium]